MLKIRLVTIALVVAALLGKAASPLGLADGGF